MAAKLTWLSIGVLLLRSCPEFAHALPLLVENQEPVERRAEERRAEPGFDLGQPFNGNGKGAILLGRHARPLYLNTLPYPPAPTKRDENQILTLTSRRHQPPAGPAKPVEPRAAVDRQRRGAKPQVVVLAVQGAHRKWRVVARAGDTGPAAEPRHFGSAAASCEGGNPGASLAQGGGVGVCIVRMSLAIVAVVMPCKGPRVPDPVRPKY